MQELLIFIGALGLAVVTNIALGMYYKIGKEKIAFDWRVLLNGVIKGIVVGGSFVSVAWIIELTNLTDEVVPLVVVSSAIVIYLRKIKLHWDNIFKEDTE